MATSTESVDLVGDEAATNLARAALFAALVGAFAYVTFPNPVSPVSVTLQVLGVFLAGIYLGPVWGRHQSSSTSRPACWAPRCSKAAPPVWASSWASRRATSGRTRSLLPRSARSSTAA